MLRLIKNDFRLNAVWLLLFCVLLMLMEVTPWVGDRRAFSGLLRGVGMANLMIVALLARESYYGGYVLHRTLPIEVHATVAGKYVTIGLLVLAFASLGQLFQEMVGLVTHSPFAHYQIDIGYPVDHSLIVRVVGWWMLLAILLPLIFRYGTALRIAIGYVVIGTLYAIAVFPLLNVSVSGARILGMKGWILFIEVMFVVISVLSFKMSVGVLQRKEF